MSDETAQQPVALVTGAAQGLGYAIARKLAQTGFAVIANDLPVNVRDLERLTAEIGGTTAVSDVADADALARAIRAAESEVGAVDTLVANAAYMALGDFLDQEPIEWWRQVEVNLSGVHNSVAAVLPGMLERRRGRIVVISSRWGVTGWPGASAYAASKAGLISYAKSLARALAREGILVNVVAPGAVDTPQLASDAAAEGVSRDVFLARASARIPAGRVLAAEEVAETVAFLTSVDAEAIVGQVLQPNGGSATCNF